MIKSFIKKLLLLKQKNLKILRVDNINDYRGLDLSCIPDNEEHKKSTTIKRRRDIARITKATQYHSQWIRDKTARIKSPFSDKILKPIASLLPYIDSYHCILYEYHDKEKFYLIVGDYWYEKLGLYFPERKQVILKREVLTDIKKMISLLPIYKSLGRNKKIDQTSIVLYHDHLAHHILNELIGIDNLINKKLIQYIDHIYYCDTPLGELKDLFPEIQASKFAKVSRRELNQKSLSANELILPYQTVKISQSSIRRINNYLELHSNKSFLKSIREKISAYDICIWVSVRTGNRVLTDQIELMASLKTEIETEGLSVIYIIDGYSEPYQLSSREKCNYKNIVADENKIIQDLEDTGITNISLIGKPIQDVLSCTALADYYICHSGTLHHKVSWLQNLPGIIHSNEHFSNLEDDLLPGMKEKEWQNIPSRIPLKAISDVVENTKDRSGNSLTEKHNNYSLDIEIALEQIISALKKESII